MDTVIANQPCEKPLAIGLASGIEVVKHLNAADWRSYVDRHPQGNIFHTPEMFDVFVRTKGFHPTLWAAVRGDGQIEALFQPVQVTLNNLLRPFTTRAISYGSVLCSPSEEGHRALSTLLDAYLQQSRGTCLFTELRNVSSLECEQPILQERGFAYEEHLNYLIDLQGSPEDVFQRIGARTRKNLKRGIHKGEVTMQEATQPEQMDACYSLLSRTYHAAKVPLADRSLFDAAFALLHPKGMVRFTLAYVGATPVAVSVDLLYRDVMYGWYGGMDRAFSSHVPNDLIMWDVLKWGSENGYRLYDFGGAGRPEEKYGVRDFKAKFGGKLVCYGRNTYVHLPAVLWLSKQGYYVARHLFNGRF